MPPPTDIGTLISFMRSVQFYSKFLPPYLSTITESLHKLTSKGQQWKWSKEEQEAFERLKNLLCTNNLLAHYDSSLELGVSCDASKFGIGAVLFHRYSDGSERPIANVSRTLTDTQHKYSQIHKETLAVVFVLKKFHQFLYGRHLVTDNKPLLALLDPARRHPF